MQIKRHPPLVRRGVTQLMYVGDDEAVDKAVSSGNRKALAISGLAALVFGGGPVRVAGGIALALSAWFTVTD